MEGLKLCYFNLRGRGEPIRLLLALTGQKYEDIRVEIGDWPGDFKEKAPFSQLPYIEFANGKKYAQQHAIALYLAKELGRAGNTNLDLLRILEVINLWEDQLKNFSKYRWEKDAAVKAETLKTLLEVEIPKFLTFYDKLLADNGSTGYYVGKDLTIADLYTFDMIQNVTDLKPDAVDDFSNLQKLRANVLANPKVKAYIDNRPDTPF